MMLCLALSYFFGYYLSVMLHQPQTAALIGGLWAMISTVIVFDNNAQTLYENIHIRMVGTFVGVCCACIIFYCLGLVFWTFLLAIFLTMMLSLIFNLPAFRLACLSVSLIYVLSIVNPSTGVLTNGGLRFIESVVGAWVPWVLGWPFRYWFKSHN